MRGLLLRSEVKKKARSMFPCSETGLSRYANLLEDAEEQTRKSNAALSCCEASWEKNTSRYDVSGPRSRCTDEFTIESV